MPTLKDKILYDLENLERILAEIPDAESLPQLSILELAGLAALLQNFYKGIENILKNILLEKAYMIQSDGSWHKNLLNQALN
jgi:hypothetical protein